MDKAVYGQAIENLKNKTAVRLLTNEKNYLKWTSKPKYISQKMFHNNLVVFCKNKVTLTLRKPAYVRMYLLNLSKVLMYEFHYN